LSGAGAAHEDLLKYLFTIIIGVYAYNVNGASILDQVGFREIGICLPLFQLLPKKYLFSFPRLNPFQPVSANGLD